MSALTYWFDNSPKTSCMDFSLHLCSLWHLWHLHVTMPQALSKVPASWLLIRKLDFTNRKNEIICPQIDIENCRIALTAGQGEIITWNPTHFLAEYAHNDNENMTLTSIYYSLSESVIDKIALGKYSFHMNLIILYFKETIPSCNVNVAPFSVNHRGSQIR